MLGINFTIGYSQGYLSDPYKRVVFDGYGDPDDRYQPDYQYTGFPENRPATKLREVIYLSVQQAFPNVEGALEGSYRFHHDDWGINANTFTLQWHQKATKWVTLSPLFRFHTQSQAGFYGTHFEGVPDEPPSDPPAPQHYSADYRLSELVTYTYGIGVSLHLHEHVTVDLAYKRYEMFGKDHVTAADMYPKANAWTGGLSVWF